MRRILLAAAAALLAGSGAAHHSILGKFDDGAAVTVHGVVTYVDWRNPHAHIFMNVGSGDQLRNWAVELDSPVELAMSGWGSDTLVPGDAIVVDGWRARDGSRQLWGEQVVRADNGRQVYQLRDSAPPLPLAPRPVPRWPDGQAALGATSDSSDGYWGYPSMTALVEDGADVEISRDGLLADIRDADDVAPLQPWALALFEYRQSRHLRDDPQFLNCKPPGGPRQYQSNLGFKLVEDRATERVFVLMGSGNHNYRIIYLDGRDQVGQVTGDDDNPLYYGRSTGRWEGDTLVVDTRSFNEDFWFTSSGLPHTNRLRLTERFTRVDLDTLEYQVEVNDPGAYTRPWTATWTLRWVGGQELPVHFCQHNRP
jgi:hypothetical protein